MCDTRFYSSIEVSTDFFRGHLSTQSLISTVGQVGVIAPNGGALLSVGRSITGSGGTLKHSFTVRTQLCGYQVEQGPVCVSLESQCPWVYLVSQ